MKGEAYFKMIHTRGLAAVFDLRMMDTEYFLCKDQSQTEAGNVLAVLTSEEVIKDILLFIQADGMPAVADDDPDLFFLPRINKYSGLFLVCIVYGIDQEVLEGLLDQHLIGMQYQQGFIKLFRDILDVEIEFRLHDIQPCDNVEQEFVDPERLHMELLARFQF